MSSSNKSNGSASWLPSIILHGCLIGMAFVLGADPEILREMVKTYIYFGLLAPIVGLLTMTLFGILTVAFASLQDRGLTAISAVGVIVSFLFSFFLPIYGVLANAYTLYTLL